MPELELLAYTSLVMKRRTVQRWIIWLLPLMVLRAFVPAGFMVAAQAGDLSLVFCPSVSTGPHSGADVTADRSEGLDTRSAATAHHDHAAHHSEHSAPSVEHQAHHGSQSEAAEHHADGANSCPFALTAVASAPEIDFFVGEPATASYSLRFSAVLFSSPGPQRAASIRAPPAFI